MKLMPSLLFFEKEGERGDGSWAERKRRVGPGTGKFQSMQEVEIGF